MPASPIRREWVNQPFGDRDGTSNCARDASERSSAGGCNCLSQPRNEAPEKDARAIAAILIFLLPITLVIWQPKGLGIGWSATGAITSTLGPVTTLPVLLVTLAALAIRLRMREPGRQSPQAPWDKARRDRRPYLPHRGGLASIEVTGCGGSCHYTKLWGTAASSRPKALRDRRKPTRLRHSAKNFRFLSADRPLFRCVSGHHPRTLRYIFR
jgi:hypothetical protein